MSEEIKKDSEQQPNNSTPEEKGGKGEGKMFTQDEVNRIISDRLAKERAKSQDHVPDQTEKENEHRSTVLDCKDYLDQRNKRTGSNYPHTLVDLLHPASLTIFKDQMHAFESIVSGLSYDGVKKKQTILKRAVSPSVEEQKDTYLRSAFGLKRKD